MEEDIKEEVGRIVDVGVLCPEAGDSLLITVDIGQLPRSRAEKYMDDVLDAFEKRFEGQDLKFLVVPSRVSVSLIRKVKEL